MPRKLRLTLAALLTLTVLLTACKGKRETAEAEAFAFVVYPGARYLGQLTETTKQAHQIVAPGKVPPATAIYDSDASVEEVAQYYAKEYGYGDIAPDPGAAATKPRAYYRTGDLATDTKAIEPLLPQLNLSTDLSKATGMYKAAELQAKPNRPRVTIQRPYYDVTTAQVVDKTLILMSR